MTTQAPPMPEQPLDVDILQDNLRKHVFLIHVCMGFWRGQYQLKHAEVRLGGQTTDASRTTRPQLKLWDTSDRLKTFRERLQKLDSERQEILKHYSEPTEITGVRIVPSKAMQPLLDELVGPQDPHTKRARFAADRYIQRHADTEKRARQSVKYRFEAIVDEIVAVWPQLVAEMRANAKPQEWLAVAHKIPTASTIDGFFYISIGRMELASRQLHAVNVDDLQGYEQLLNECAERQANEFVTQMLTGPRQALTKALEELNELIMRNGSVKSNSFNAAREAIAKIRMFDFVANPDLLRSIEVLEARLDITTASELDSTTAVQNGFIELINQTVEVAASDIAVETDRRRFGRNLRGIDLG